MRFIYAIFRNVFARSGNNIGWCIAENITIAENDIKTKVFVVLSRPDRLRGVAGIGLTGTISVTSKSSG